jgi:hypothetical protein
MKRTLFPVSCLVLAAAATAQVPASYVLYGTGCNGSAPATCLAQNDQNPSMTVSSLPNEYGYPVINTTGGPIQVVGFEVYTVTNGTIPTATLNTGIFRDNSGAGATVHTQPSPVREALGSITALNTRAWYPTTVYPPVWIAAGEAFWLGVDAYSQIAPPQHVAGGVAGPASIWYRRPTLNNYAWTVSVSVVRPIFRVHCVPASPTVPALVNTGRPVLGQSFDLRISGGEAFGLSILIWGFNNVSWLGFPIPVDLGPFGAPTCLNYTSTEFLDWILLDPAGSVLRTVQVPSDLGLLGVPFFNQAAVLRPPGHNALNLHVSNAGAGVLGT